MVGAGQFALQGLGGGQFAAVAGQDSGEDGHRVEDGQLLVVTGGSCLAAGRRVRGEPVGAVEFGGGPAAFAGVGGPAEVGYAIGVVGVAAAAHGDVQSLPVAEAVDQDVRGAGGAAERGVRGGRVREGGVLGEVARGIWNGADHRGWPVPGSRPVSRRTSACVPRRGWR